MLRLSNESKKALGSWFFNLSALAFAGAFVESVFTKEGITAYFACGMALVLVLCFAGIYLTEKSAEKSAERQK